MEKGENLVKALQEIRSNNNIDTEQLEKTMIRLEKYSDICQECKEKLENIKALIIEFSNNLEEKGHKEITESLLEITSHLENTHKLVAEGYYVGICLALGAGFGLVLGLLFFDHIGFGLPIGAGIGVFIGSILDRNAKNNHNVI